MLSIQVWWKSTDAKKKKISTDGITEKKTQYKTTSKSKYIREFDLEP